MSDSDDEPIFAVKVPLRDPAKTQRDTKLTSADEILQRRQKFWSIHEALSALEDPKIEVERPKVPPKVVRLPVEQPSVVIQSRHPGPPHPCNTQRDLSFDPVLFVLNRCRADAALGDKFKQVDRSRFLSVLHIGFPNERWSKEERLALAGHLLLLCALANEEAVAKACARQLRLERCKLRDVLPVALSWGAAIEDLQLPQDLHLSDVTPAQPPPWCVVHTLRVLPALLCKPTSAGSTLPESASTVSDTSVADVALAARALALCALDSRGAQVAEFIPAFAAVLATVKPWTEQSIEILADALHFPTAHEHAQAWVLANLVQDQPLRKLLASRLLLSLLTPSTKIIGQPQPDQVDVSQPMEGLEEVGRPFAGTEPTVPIAAGVEAIMLPVTDYETVSPLGQPSSDPSNLQVTDDPMASVVADSGENACMDSIGSEAIDDQANPGASHQAEWLAANQCEAMDVVERPSSRASTVSVELDLDSPSNDILNNPNQLSGLVQLLGRRLPGQICSLDTYRRFIFVLVLAAYGGTNPISSPQDATDLRQLMAWLPKILITVPATTSQLDTVLIQSLIATTTSLWQGALERHAEDASFSLSQSAQSQLSVSQQLLL